MLLSSSLRDVAAVIGLFAVAYSATLVGATLIGLEIPGDPVDAVIALSVGYVGVMIAFGARGAPVGRDPRLPALIFGLAHGLGLSSLLQELQLPGDDVLPAVIGFNVGVELGQIGAMVLVVALLFALRAFPVPSRQHLPAGCGFIAVGAALLAFVVFGVQL